MELQNRLFKFRFGYLLLVYIIVGCSSSQTGSPESIPSGSQKGTSGTYTTEVMGRKSEANVKDRLDRRFLGTWKVEGSSAMFTISLKKGVVLFSGKDLEDGEQFKISSINWDKNTFQGSFTMPSTQHSTTVKLSIIDDSRLRCEFYGDSEGESEWNRQ